jgi:cobalamin transport system ATP-binding protein
LDSPPRDEPRPLGFGLLQATDLRFSYGRAGRRASHQDGAPVRPVIDGVSVAVPRGAVVGLLGPNGSGKTTLLKLLSGALEPAAGEVALDGRPLTAVARRDLARRVAVVPQETHLAFDYSVLEIALMGRYPWLGPFEIEGPDDLAAAMEALDATGTSQFADRPFPTLSGGEKQRVIIASALAQLDDRTGATGASPRLLFLDEPTASLDLRYQLEIGSLIARLHAERQVTILLSSHDLRLVSAVCSTVILLSRGRVQDQGSTTDVLTADAAGRLYEIDPRLAAPLLA